MPTSRQHLEACLTKLRAAGLTPPKAASNQDGFALHIAVWLERLSRYDPRAVSAAFERWIDTKDEWPLPKSLLPLVDEQQARLEGKPRITKPQSGLDDLNAALERLMAELPSSIHVRLYALHDAAPHDRRRIINRLAEWSLAYPDHVRAEALAVAARELEQVEGHA